MTMYFQLFLAPGAILKCVGLRCKKSLKVPFERFLAKRRVTVLP